MQSCLTMQTPRSMGNAVFWLARDSAKINLIIFLKPPLWVLWQTNRTTATRTTSSTTCQRNQEVEEEVRFTRLLCLHTELTGCFLQIHPSITTWCPTNTNLEGEEDASEPQPCCIYGCERYGTRLLTSLRATYQLKEEHSGRVCEGHYRRDLRRFKSMS